MNKNEEEFVFPRDVRPDEGKWTATVGYLELDSNKELKPELENAYNIVKYTLNNNNTPENKIIETKIIEYEKGYQDEIDKTSMNNTKYEYDEPCSRTLAEEYSIYDCYNLQDFYNRNLRYLFYKNRFLYPQGPYFPPFQQFNPYYPYFQYCH